MSPGAPGPDEPVRERVRSELQTAFVVEAGAGTGKTTLLIDRICNLVRGGTPMRGIAAITFTEKAAGELKVRLRGELLRHALFDAVADLESAAITTIHSFCLNLLKEHPFAAGVDPRFGVGDQATTGLLFEETLDDWLAGALRDPPPGLAAAVGSGATPAHIRELAAALRARPDCPGLPDPVGADPHAFVKGVEHDIGQLVTWCEQGPADDKAVLQVQALQGTADDTGGEPLEARALALADALLGAGKTARLGNKTKWKKAAAVLTDQVRPLLESLQERAAVFDEAWFGDLLTGLLHDLRGALDAYAAAKERRGLLDFDDLLLRTRALLVEHPAVRDAVARRYPVVLVDEVQDTDPLQADVITALLGAPREPGAPAPITLVGDPKQSLYRFRRADLALYERLAETVAAHANGERVDITRTHRNVPRLAAWINRVCGEVLTKPEGGLQARWVPLDSGVEPLPDAPEPVVLLTPPEDAEPLKADARRACESWRVAELLRRAVEVEHWQVRDRDHPAGRRAIRYGDIALLFRNFSNLEFWEDALRAAGIPFRVAGGRLFFRRLEVQALESLATAIDDPGNRVAVVAALKGPFIGCSDEDLFRHQASGRLDPLAPGDGPCAEPLAVLGELHRTRNVWPVADTLARALAGFRAWPLLRSLSNGAHRVANIEKLLDLARQQQETGLLTFRAFARYLQRFGQERGAAEPDSQPAEPGEESVLLYTVHGSKGLEFPVVVLSDVAAGRRSDILRATPVRDEQRLEVSLSVEGRRWSTAGAADAELAEAGHRDAEERRTFYVALTRAKDRLVIPALWGKRADGYAGYLLEAAEHLGEDAEVRVIDPLEPGEVPQAAPKVRPDWAGGATHPVRSERAEWQAGMAGLLEAMAVPAPPEPGPPVPADVVARAEHAKAIGLAVHEVLEAIDLAAPGDLDAVCTACARKYDVPDGVAEVRAIVDTALGMAVTQRAAAAARCWRELPIYVRETKNGADWISPRRADVLFEEANGKLVLADWKTDRELSPEAEREYTTQLRRYAGALKAAGRTVDEAWLLLVRTGKPVPIAI